MRKKLSNTKEPCDPPPAIDFSYHKQKRECERAASEIARELAAWARGRGVDPHATAVFEQSATKLLYRAYMRNAGRPTTMTKGRRRACQR